MLLLPLVNLGLAASEPAVVTVYVPQWDQPAKNIIWRKKTRWVEQGFLSVPIIIHTPSSGSIYHVRVEANDIASATLRWDYNGSASVKVYRSTDNISYSLVDTVTSTYPTIEYEYVDDNTLAERTLYYYKLTDDNGLTYTAPVKVVSYLVAATRGNATSSTVSVMPAVFEVRPEDFNALVDKINFDNQARTDQSNTPCEVCSSNGSLVIDCSSGCEWFKAILTEDINSISLIGCDGCPPVDFVIPPNVSRSVCGWPTGCNYEGDECYDAPIPGGVDGRVAKTNGLTYGGYWNAGKPGPLDASSCPCSKASTVLSINVCSGTLSC